MLVLNNLLRQYELHGFEKVRACLPQEDSVTYRLGRLLEFASRTNPDYWCACHGRNPPLNDPEDHWNGCAKQELLRDEQREAEISFDALMADMRSEEKAASEALAKKRLYAIFQPVILQSLTEEDLKPIVFTLVRELKRRHHNLQSY